MSRPRKPLAQLQLTGAYRQDRHGGRCDDLVAVDRPPRKPAWIVGDAAWLWRLITRNLLPGMLLRVDTPTLASCCRWWALWREYDQQLADGAGNAYKVMLQATMAWKNFEKAASKLGLSPVDRAKLQLPPVDDGVAPVRKRARRGGDPLEDLMARRQEHFADPPTVPMGGAKNA